jgi:phenylacetate-CoA ligase
LPNRDPAKPAVLLTPDLLRNAVIVADRSIDDFRVWQTGENHVRIVLPVHVGQAAGEAARTMVVQACARVDACPVVDVQYEPLQPQTDTKLRRVENRWKRAGS